MNTDSKSIVVIDGSQGEGGGQIFRTALTLSTCLGQAVRIENIRAGRNKPGLLRQHLTCLQATQAICDAQITGAELGSSSVTFSPGAIKAGEYRFAIGSAGSTTLVFQTVLLPLLMTESVSELTIEGGTHNGMSPSYDFIAHCFLPVMLKMGYQVEPTLERHGFYPAGGGAWRARISPVSTIKPLTLLQPGEQLSQSAFAISSRISKHVAERELHHIQKKCLWPEASLHQQWVQSAGPGNIVTLRLEMEDVIELCEAVGERNVTAERVAGRAIRDLKRYLAAGVPVGKHLADQLVLPMALGSGGCFRTLKPSQHLLTNIAVIRTLTNANIELNELGEDCWEVLVTGAEIIANR